MWLRGLKLELEIAVRILLSEKIDFLIYLFSLSYQGRINFKGCIVYARML